jgi:hypothetical protein
MTGWNRVVYGLESAEAGKMVGTGLELSGPSRAGGGWVSEDRRDDTAGNAEGCKSCPDRERQHLAERTGASGWVRNGVGEGEGTE